MVKGWDSSSPDNTDETVVLRQADIAQRPEGKARISYASESSSIQTDKSVSARTNTKSCETDSPKYTRLVSYFQDLVAGLDVSSLDAVCKNFINGMTPGSDTSGRPQTRTRNDLSDIDEISVSLSALDYLDSCSDVLSIKANIAYWRLGNAYRMFGNDCLSSDNFAQADLSCSPRQRNRLVLAKLMKSDMIKAYLLNSNHAVDKALHAKLAQRFQRARKVYCIAVCVGLPILFYVPRMCITRIDKLSIVMLEANLTPELQSAEDNTAHGILEILLRHIRSLLSSIDLELDLL